MPKTDLDQKKSQTSIIKSLVAAAILSTCIRPCQTRQHGAPSSLRNGPTPGWFNLRNIQGRGLRAADPSFRFIMRKTSRSKSSRIAALCFSPSGTHPWPFSRSAQTHHHTPAPQGRHILAPDVSPG